MTQLTTAEEIRNFIMAGDPKMDPDWFWGTLEVESEALAQFCVHTASVLNINPGVVGVLMTYGARMALRHDGQGPSA